MFHEGGISTLRGVRYEVQAVVYEIPNLLEGQLITVRYQPASSSLSADQPPIGIFTDDYAAQDEKGQKSLFQAKQSSQNISWTINRLLREGVLQQFWNQHCVEPQSSLFFVSDTPAPKLNNLADKARQSISTDEFQRTLTKNMQQDAQQILEILNISWKELWFLLKTINHRLLTEDQIQQRITDYASGRYADPDKFALVLKDLIETSPGRPLTRDTVIAHLENLGLFRLPMSLPQDIRKILLQASGSLRAYKSNILGDIHIEREETAKLENWIETTQEQHPVAFLLDVAGSGKSVILHDLLDKLEYRAIPVLAIKADLDLSHDVKNAATMEHALNLPLSPESLLTASVAEHGKAVLIVDQLDALSLTFSRNQTCLDTVIGLIGRVSSIQGVRVVGSCRTFDRKFDPKLRQIHSDREFTIKPLTELEIQRVLNRLGLGWNDLTSREQELLSNPHHLDLFAMVVDEGNKRGVPRRIVATAQDLYDVLWEIKIDRPSAPRISPYSLQDAIYRLVDAIHSSQELYQHPSLFNRILDTRDYLESEGILRRDDNKLTFFHQSFFDYCYARRFVSQNVSLAETVRRGEQGFFVRPQIVQTLSYLKGANRQRYLRELESLMDRWRIHEWLRQLKMRPGTFRRILFAAAVRVLGTPVRYHLRHLAFAWFGQQTNLDEQEKALGLPCIRSPKDRHLFLLGSRGNVEWFDVIQPHLASLFALPDKALDKEIVPFLHSVQEARPKEIFGLFTKQLGVSDQWNVRISWCLNSHKDWQTAEAEQCLLWLCENGQTPWHDLGLALHHIAKANTPLGCKALKIILDRLRNKWQQMRRPLNAAECSERERLNGKYNDEAAIKEYMHRKGTFDEHAHKLVPKQLFWLDDLVNRAAEECPAILIETILPWLEQVLPDLTWHPDDEGWLRDEIFSLRFVHPFDGPSSMMIQGFYKALSRLAEEDQEHFLAFAARLEQSRYLVLHQILADVLTKNAAHYAFWAYNYLLKDTLLFQIGEISSATLFSRKLVGAIFPHLSSDERAELEKNILSYYPEWENRAENLRWRGSDQLELLWEVPDELLTPKGRNARRVLMRKFEGYEPPERRSKEVELAPVGSPIPEEKTKILTDDGWLDAMRHYDDETSWGKPREKFLKEGVVQLSRAFEKVVETEPQRFAQLALRFDESISSHYFCALLDGLAKSTVPSRIVFELCETFSKMRPDDTLVQGAICDAIEKRVKEKVPKKITEIVRSIALTSADPDHEAWQTKTSTGEYYYGGDPHCSGINSTRGRAVRVYVRCMLEASRLDTETLLSTMEKVGADPSSAVRSCLIEVLPYLLRFDSTRVVGIFDATVEGRPELLACHVSDNFIYYALRQHGLEMLKYIEVLRKSQREEVRETAGRLATLAHFSVSEAKPLFRRCLGGDAALRRGVAKVLARNVDEPRLLKQCLAGLRKLCDDSDESVRQNVGEVFRYLPYPTPLIKRLVDRFLVSRSIVDAANNIVDYAARIQLEHPELALLIAERTQFALGRSIVDIQTSFALLDDDLVNLAVAIQAHSTQSHLKARALDLFERIMDLGSSHATDVLKAAER